MLLDPSTKTPSLAGSTMDRSTYEPAAEPPEIFTPVSLPEIRPLVRLATPNSRCQSPMEVAVAPPRVTKSILSWK